MARMTRHEMSLLLARERDIAAGDSDRLALATRDRQEVLQALAYVADACRLALEHVEDAHVGPRLVAAARALELALGVIRKEQFMRAKPGGA
jgi:hypothetical protein